MYVLKIIIFRMNDKMFTIVELVNKINTQNSSFLFYTKCMILLIKQTDK